MRPIVITGLARSGTSAVAGVVHHLGTDLGEYYIAPDKQNPTGYFEDAEMVEVDNRHHGGSYEGWKKDMKTILEKRNKDHPWGWKLPTMAVTLPYFKEIFEELDIKPKYILVKRNEGLEESRKKHHGKLYDTAQHERIFDEELKNEEVLTVYFEDLQEKTEDTIRDIIQYIGIKPSVNQQTIATLSVLGEHPKTQLAVPSKFYRYG